MGPRLGIGMRDMPVNISYIVDESVRADACFDFGECKSLAIGMASDITGDS